MKRHQLLGWILLALSSAATSVWGAQVRELAEAECHEEGKDVLCGHAAATLNRLLAEDRNNLDGSAGSGPSDSLDSAASDIDVIHCLLDIELNFSSRTLSGSNTLMLESRTAGLDRITIDLRDNMVVDAVSIDSRPVAFTRGGHQVAITLDRTYAAGERFTTTITYRGTPQSLGWKSFTFTSSMAASLSQPWYAHTWWPCKEALDDKFTSEVWITVPSSRTAVSNGSLIGVDTLSGGRSRYRWRESHPIAAYLVSVAVADYDYASRSYGHAAGQMPVELYSYSLSESSAQTVMDHLLTSITTFSRPDVFGEYPFVSEKYGIAEYSGSVNMEHQTISSHWSFDLNIVDHELAHQWWGDMITCRTWHDIWLNEGFATYAEAIQEEKKPGGSFAAYAARMAFRRPTDYSDSVYIYDISTQTEIFTTNRVYRKAAWVLHMLRHVMGDDAFFSTLANYRAAYAGGSASTEDFRAVAESVYGDSLEWFFQEWIYGGGGPAYGLGWQYEERDGENVVQVLLRQTQTAYPLFRMPVDVRIQTASSVINRVVWHEYERHWYRIPVDGRPLAVTIDPDGWILRPQVGSETYTAPPAFRLLSTSPAPGVADMNVSRIRLQFEQVPVYKPEDFSVTGSLTGSRSFAASATNDPPTVALLFSPPLEADQVWTVRVSDRVRTLVTGDSLDGEISALGPALPSGDGLPGGDAVFSFTAAFPGDLDGDFDVDLEDFGRLQICLGEPGVIPTGPGCLDRDLDHDHDVDPFDLDIFTGCLAGAGVKPPIDCGG